MFESSIVDLPECKLCSTGTIEYAHWGHHHLFLKLGLIIQLSCFIHTLPSPRKMLPSWILIYPLPAGPFDNDFPFSKMGYLSSPDNARPEKLTWLSCSPENDGFRVGFLQWSMFSFRLWNPRCVCFLFTQRSQRWWGFFFIPGVDLGLVYAPMQMALMKVQGC